MKAFPVVLSALLIGASASASAHGLWTLGENREVFEADIIYGHEFPKPEPIPEKRLVLFEPLKVLSPDGTVTLKQRGEKHHYVHTRKLGKGTHVLLANYKPTYWTEVSDDKWEMNKTRADFPQAKHCGLYTMQGKSFVIVDDSGDDAMKPVGKGFEITPMVNPTKIAANELVKFRVTNDGKPVAGAEIVGSPAGFNSEEVEIEAFRAETDERGEFQFRALKSGLWYLSGEFERAGKDPKTCEDAVDEFTLSFNVN